MRGKIHSVDTFSTLDGPGIRTVVFMQGCHLRCKYCHNPDTWSCEAATAREYSADEIMKIIMRSLPYFESSGGGVTFSGGEPLLQADFIGEIFKECQGLKIHTAIDTSLYVSSKTVLQVAPYTNLFLADIKHIKSEKSQNLTGASNKHNLENLRIINERHIDIWIRYVIVPGLTDDEEDIKAMADFLSELDTVVRVDLLPYHSLGSHKWKLLGIKYELDDVTPPTHERMKELKALVEGVSKKAVFIPG